MMPHVSLEEILGTPIEYCAGCDRVVECEMIRREYRHCHEYMTEHAHFDMIVPEEIQAEAVELALSMLFPLIIKMKAQLN